MASIITALTILAANTLILDGVDGTDAADMNGGAAKVTFPDDGSANFDPTKIVLTANDPGFDSNGNLLLAGLGGPVRTIRGTAVLRKQWPNQTSRMNSASGGVRTVYFALSGPVYPGTQLTAAAEAGYHNAAAAGSIPAPTNSSTRAYPKPNAVILNQQHDRATGANLHIEAVVLHRWGRNRKSVACVKYRAQDSQGTPGQTPEISVSAPTLSTLCKQGQPPEVWAADIPLANLAQGDLCFANLKAYPWLGDATAVLDFTGADATNTTGPLTTPQPYTPLRFVCDRTGGYGGARAYVRLTGTLAATSTAGVFTADQPYPLTDAQCYPTIAAACQALQAFNAANKGHDDLGGATVYFTDDGAGGAAVHTSLATGASRTAGLALLDIRKDPNAVGAVSWNLSTQQAITNRTRIAISGKHSAANGLNGFNTAGKMLVLEDMTLDYTGGGPSVPINYQTPLTFWRNVTITNPISGLFSPFNGPDLKGEALILGVVIDDSTADMNTGSAYCIVGSRMRRTRVGAAVDRCVIFNNIFREIRNVNATGFGNSLAITSFAFVQNVYEDARATNGATLFGIGYDGTTVPIENFLFAHNTFPSRTITGRFNFAYADTAIQVTKRMALLYNVLPGQINTKTDTCIIFSSSTGRNGNWGVRYGVEKIGNLFGSSTQGETTTDPDGGLPNPGNWIGEYLDPSNKLGSLALTFTDDKSGQGAAGMGTYTLTGTTNDAYNRVPNGGAMLAYDLGGRARLNDGTGAAGAYERDLPPITGAAAITEPGDTLSGTAAGGRTGSASIVEGGDAASGVGKLAISAGGSVVEGSDTASGTGSLTIGAGPIMTTGPIIAGTDRLVSVNSTGSGYAWAAPFDPSDRAPYAIDWSGLLRDGETIKQIDRITMSPQGASLGVQVDTSAGRDPIIDADSGKLTQLWFLVADAFQENAAFAGVGVPINVSLLIRTTANPYEQFERTVTLSVRQQ